MSENTLFLGNKIFEIPPFFQTRPGDLGKKVHACSLRFSALKHALRALLCRPRASLSTIKIQYQNGSCRFLWKNLLYCVEVIMAETQHVKSFEMRLNTRCLWSVVVCNGNRRSWSQLWRVLERV